MKVIITTTARLNLADIEKFISADNPARAASFSDELLDRCDDLSSMAERFGIVPGMAGNIRRRAYRGYLIFYRINIDTVEVLHILHGAQEWESWLRDEPNT